MRGLETSGTAKVRARAVRRRGKARGHLRPKRQHWHCQNPQRRLRRGQSWCAELEASSWSCSRRQSSAGSRGKAAFFTAHPNRPGSDSRTPAHTNAHTFTSHWCTHTRVLNRPVPRRVSGWGRTRWGAGHLPPLGRKPRQPLTPPSTLPATTRPRVPVPSARESPRRSSPALS